MSALRTAACLVVLACIAVACTTASKPDLRRLYAMRASYAEQPPLIVIPGIMGSELVDRESGAEAWPGNWWKLATSRYADLALDIDPQTLEPRPSRLVPADITEQALGIDFYGQLLHTLIRFGGYVRSEPGEPAPADAPPRLYVFAYDWRQDNVETARRLDALVEQIRRDHGDPDLKVDVVAHSMGGLVVRYYLRYGTTDVLDDNEFPVNLHGANRIRRVVLLGTPNLGSITSLHSFLKGIRVGLRRIPPEVLATMPSIYQLFPHPILDWLITAEGRPLDRDLFSRELWERFQWSIFEPALAARLAAEGHDMDTLRAWFGKRLERARRFVWSLSVALPESPIQFIVLGGDCRLTPARALVEEVDGESVIRLYPGEIKRPVAGVDYEQLMLEPGDGRVTKPSLLARDSLDPSVPRHEWSFFPLAFSFSLCEDHDTLTGNINFQDNLLNVLLTRTRDGQ